MTHKLKHQRDSLINYLESKISAQDWHAVADAAMDLREIDAQLKLLDSIIDLGIDKLELEQILNKEK